MLGKRLIIALIILPLLYFSVMYLPALYFLFLMVIVTFLAQSECLSMYKVKAVPRYLFSLVSVAPLLILYRYHAIPSSLIIVICSGLFFARLFMKKSPEYALMDLSPYFVGFFYISLLLSYSVLIRDIGPEWIVFLCGVVWGADSFAYSMGKTFGRRALYKSVSPAKTVEGAYGAVAGAVIVSVLFKFLLSIDLSLEITVVVGIIVSFTGMTGDLVESMFKRDAQIKDSSGLLPGHGGMLDKIDGMLFSAPALYYLLLLFL